jgi:methionyl-tRNA synthetase
MSEVIHVSVAWPYANGDMHIGHLAGAYLPSDIFARYQRLKGNRVLMVSGSDAHGTPITVTAEREGVTPREVFEKYHRRFLEVQQQIGISYDLFTHTDTENHYRVSQDIFTTLYERGYLYKETQQLLYDEEAGRFLPDRLVEGTCYICGYEDARGDQCDNCGHLQPPRRARHRAFLPRSPGVRRRAARLPQRQGLLASERNQLCAEYGRRPEGPPHHPRHQVGHPRAAGGLG